MLTAILETCLMAALLILYAINAKQAWIMGKDAIPRTGSAIVSTLLFKEQFILAIILLFLGFVCAVFFSSVLNHLPGVFGLWASFMNLTIFMFYRWKQIDRHAYAIARKLTYDAAFYHIEG